MTNEALRDAIIEAARKLVREHVESEIVVNKNNGVTYLNIGIQPIIKFRRHIPEGDTLPDDLFGALADLLGAVDSYDEWRAESDNT